MGVSTFWQIDSSGGTSMYDETNAADTISEQLQMIFSIRRGELLNSTFFGHDLGSLSFGSMETSDIERIAKLLATQALIESGYPYVGITAVKADLNESGKTYLHFDYQVIGVDITGTIVVPL